MPWSTSSSRRGEPGRALGEQPLLQVGQLGAERGERRLAVGLVAVEARASRRCRSTQVDRARPAAAASATSASCRRPSARSSRTSAEDPAHVEACSRRPWSTVPSPCGSSNHSPSVKPTLASTRSEAALRWSGAAKNVAASGKRRRARRSIQAHSIRVPSPRPIQPGRRSRSRPRSRPGRARARRSRGSRRSGSPARSPTERPLTSTTHIRVGRHPVDPRAVLLAHRLAGRLAVGDPPALHVVALPPADHVGQVAAGHRPQRPPPVVVDRRTA